MSIVGTVETSEGPLAELCKFNFNKLHLNLNKIKKNLKEKI